MQEQQTRKTIEELVVDIDRRLDQVDDHLQFTSPIAERDETGDKRRCVLMACGGLLFAVPLEGVSEIGGLPIMTSLPNLPYWIHGVVSLRGEVVSVVDIVGYYKWKTAAAASGDRLVVIHSDGVKIGMRADKIIGSANIDFTKDIIEKTASPEIEGIEYSKACKIEDQVFCLLNPEELLKEKRMLEW